MTTKELTYRVIDVCGYHRKAMLGKIVVKKWIEPYKRKIKCKPIDTAQKTIEEFEAK